MARGFRRLSLKIAHFVIFRYFVTIGKRTIFLLAGLRGKPSGHPGGRVTAEGYFSVCVYIYMRVYAFFYYNTLNPFNSNALSVVNAIYYIYYKLYKIFTVYALSVVDFFKGIFTTMAKSTPQRPNLSTEGLF